MAETVGKTAAVRTGTALVVGIRAWTLDFTADALETTDFGDSGHKTFLAGLDGWSGSFEGFGQPGWSLAAVVGTTYAGSFYVDNSAGSCYSGSIIITGSHPATAVDGQSVISYDFQGTGVLVYD